MTVFHDRTGDFTKKKHLYKFYKNGYTSRAPKYMTAGQYLDATLSIVGDSSIAGHAYVEGGGGSNNLSIFANGDSNVGVSATALVETDLRRQFDIYGFKATMSHGYGTSNFGGTDYYEFALFDYKIRRTISGNTLKAYYKTTEIASVTMSSSYDYIRMRESGGTFYIDRSSDGVTWTAWVNHTIDPAADKLRTTMTLESYVWSAGLGTASIYVNNIEATDRHNNLLAVETEVLSDLEYDVSINNPASSTKILLPYSPQNVPEYCDMGNFVEIYTNFYDDGVIQYEGILDHNGDPILDENDQPISGVVLHGNVPEQASILKFSGYIDAIDYDYDNGLIELTVVSHGETMANSLVRDGNISVPVISQLQYGGLYSTVDRRQLFVLTKNTKIDAIRLRVSYGAGGGSAVEFGQGNQVLGTTHTFLWSGGLGEGDLVYELPQSLYLEAGTYWFRETGGINAAVYTASQIYAAAPKQQYDQGIWLNQAQSFYFELYTTQLQTAVTLSGSSQEVAASIFEKSLSLDYSPLYLGEVQEAGYDINIGLNLDSAKNAVAALYRQLPTRWFYRVDVGTGEVSFRDKSSAPDHLLVFGRDFTEMKITKDIDGIINDVYYIGAALVENGPKLTVRSTDIDSVADYRQGLSIQSNDKVTRYDTAQLLSENIIDNNNAPRLTTEITLSSARYNTEMIKSGDVIKIANGDGDVLGTTLVVATLRYKKSEVTISLDTAPRNLSRTIDAINRQLENMQTANATAVV